MVIGRPMVWMIGLIRDIPPLPNTPLFRAQERFSLLSKAPKSWIYCHIYFFLYYPSHCSDTIFSFSSPCVGKSLYSRQCVEFSRCEQGRPIKWGRNNSSTRRVVGALLSLRYHLPELCVIKRKTLCSWLLLTIKSMKSRTPVFWHVTQCRLFAQ